MDDLLAPVRKYAQRYRLFSPGETVVVGVSGGPDSLCLLHLLRRLAPELRLWLHVAHLHHGLRGIEADADATFVAELADCWGLPCTIGRADVTALAREAGQSLEEAARQARYRFLAEIAEAGGAATLAVGHNADDQAETVLMHFLRGSGAAGLRGMLPRTPLDDYRLFRTVFDTGHDASAAEGSGETADDQESSALDGVNQRHLRSILSDGNGEAGDPLSSSDPHVVASPRLHLVRPLLAIPRAEIEAYCVKHRLAPRIDRSNADTTFFRNRLRHELLPILETYNPGIRDVLSHTAEVLAGDHAVLSRAVEIAWTSLVSVEGPDEVRFSLPGWRGLPLGLQRATCREAIHRLRRSVRDINWEHVERAVWLAREGHTGQVATLAAGLELSDRLRFAARCRRGYAFAGGSASSERAADPACARCDGARRRVAGERAAAAAGRGAHRLHRRRSVDRLPRRRGPGRCVDPAPARAGRPILPAGAGGTQRQAQRVHDRRQDRP